MDRGNDPASSDEGTKNGKEKCEDDQKDIPDL
jgi:hypothetical protein